MLSAIKDVFRSLLMVARDWDESWVRGSARRTQHLHRMLENYRYILVRRHKTEVAYVDNVILLPVCFRNRRQDVQRRKCDIIWQR